MLMNNLDPEVAERPDDLVVYGGTGKAARDWAAFDAIVAHAARPGRRRDAAGAVRQAGRRAAHPRVGAAGADRQLATWCRDWATWEEFRRLEALGLTMYGQMTAGSWIYIGTQGILQGTYETFAARRREALRRHPGRHDHADRRAGRHGRRAAAGGDHERRGGDLRRLRPARIARRIEHRYLDEAADDLDDALRRAWPRRRPARRCRSALLGNAAEVLPELLRRGARRSTRHRPDLGPRPADLPAARGRRSPTGGDYAGPKTRTSSPPGPGVDGRARGGHGRVPGRGRRGVRLRQLDPRRGQARPGTTRAFDFPGFVPAYIRPLFCEGKGPFRWAALSGDPADIAATDAADPRAVPGERVAAPAGSGWPGSGCTSRACRPGSAGWATASGTWPGCAFNELVAAGEVAAPDRDRPRPPGLRLGRLAVPGDRGDGRRLGRDRRLAAAERAGQHGLRGVLGVDPPRRRRRHRPLHPRRPGLRRRRHRAGRAEAGAGAHQRPGHGRDPARRRRLPRAAEAAEAAALPIPMQRP